MVCLGRDGRGRGIEDRNRLPGSRSVTPGSGGGSGTVSSSTTPLLHVLGFCLLSPTEDEWDDSLGCLPYLRGSRTRGRSLQVEATTSRSGSVKLIGSPGPCPFASFLNLFRTTEGSRTDQGPEPTLSSQGPQRRDRGGLSSDEREGLHM